MDHETAAKLVDAAIPDTAIFYRTFIQSIGAKETNYGTSWKDDPLQTTDGTVTVDPTTTRSDSHNWGAIQGVGPAGYFITKDHYLGPNGPVEYEAKYKKYDNDQQAISDLAHIALKPNVVSDLDEDSLLHAFVSLARNGYYETTVVPRDDKTFVGYVKRGLYYFESVIDSLKKIFAVRHWDPKNIEPQCYGYYVARINKGGPIVQGYVNATAAHENDIVQKLITASPNYAVLFYTIYNTYTSTWSKWRQLMPAQAYPSAISPNKG